MAAGDNPRFVVTSLAAPTPQRVYEEIYCARGTCENNIKAVKCDLSSDRTSATTFLANATRLVLACAAYALHHALRTQTLQHTGLAQAQPSTIILTLFKIAAQVKQYKDHILLHLPSSCPVKALLHPPGFPQPVVPRPSHRETPETSPSPLLSRMSRRRSAALRLAAAGRWGRRHRRGRGVAAGGVRPGGMGEKGRLFFLSIHLRHSCQSGT